MATSSAVVNISTSPLFLLPAASTVASTHTADDAFLTSSLANETSTSSSPPQRDEQLAKVEIIVQVVILLLAVCGNLLVLVALRYRKKKTSRWHWFVMHLCIADLLVAMCNILPQLAWDITFRFMGGDVLCRVVKYLQLFALYLSTYTLVMTAVDRHHAICIPTSPSSPHRVRIMITIAWVLSIVLAIPQLFIFKLTEVQPGSGVYDCWADFQPEWTLKAYVTAFGLSVYIIPFFVLFVLYSRICYKVWTNLSFKENNGFPVSSHHHPCGVVYKFNGTGHISVIGQSDNTRTGANTNTTNTAVNTADMMGKGGKVAGAGALILKNTRTHVYSAISRTKMKTIKLTFVVIVAYLLCWAPFIIAQMWWAYDHTAPINNATFVICVLLSSLNSCCNPWIYMCFSGNLVRQLICSRRKQSKPARKKLQQPREPLRHNQTPLQLQRQYHAQDGQQRRHPSSVSFTKPTDMMPDNSTPRQHETFEMKKIVHGIQQDLGGVRGSGSKDQRGNNFTNSFNKNELVIDKGFDQQQQQGPMKGSTRTHFNANDYPCVLYRPLQASQQEAGTQVKCHSV